MSERFQLDLLIGRRVVDAAGRKLGRVDEVRLVREGEHYVVEGLLIGVNGLAERLGVAHPLERLERRLNFNAWGVEDHIIYWDQIDSIGEKHIRLKVRREEIRTVRLDD
jgi:sporulation protein YlmC with PRC-barrel domain